MARVRIAGPRALVEPALGMLQELEVLHLATPPAGAALVPKPPDADDRAARRLARMLEDAEAALALMGDAPGRPRPSQPDAVSLPRAWHRAHRARARLARLARDIAALDEERALLKRYRDFFSVFEPMTNPEERFPGGCAFYVVLRAGIEGATSDLSRSLEAAVGEQFDLLARPLPSGETAVILLVSARASAQVARLLSDSRIQELPAPRDLGEANLLRAMPALRDRLQRIPDELSALQAERDRIAREDRDEIDRLRRRLHDLESRMQARTHVLEGQFLFVVEGWLPMPALTALRRRIDSELGSDVLVEVLGSEPWARADTPVALSNPRLFRPFELVTRSLPLPRYGSIDPTPFVAVFFPIFFGLMLGDAGYGLVLGLLAVGLRLTSAEASRRRALASVAGACALFSVVFGLLFGEFFGTAGRSIGLRPLALDREEALVPFMAFTVALGAVHVLIGLVLASIGAWRQGRRREALGRGVAFAMIGLSALALLAAFQVLPRALFTPAAIGVLVAFPLLVALEGIVAVVELLSAYGHILSYVRIMAIGTASLMLAVVANRMVGALGSVAVGVVFALLFHLVNFALGLFSPTIHALRLHYVEFFGKFYSPGGTAYRPLAHWRPQHGPGSG